MKKKIFAIASIVAVLAIVAVGTYAYFTAQSNVAVNTFTMGNVDIELSEPSWNSQGNNINVVPGREIAKDPTIKNTGSNDAYVRMDLTVSDAANWKAVCSTAQITDLTKIFKGYVDANWERASITEDTTDDTITYSYYYKTALAPQASTGAIFTSLVIPTAMTSAQGAAFGTDGFTITAQAYAIQAEGFTTPAAAFAEYK